MEELPQLQSNQTSPFDYGPSLLKIQVQIGTWAVALSVTIGCLAIVWCLASIIRQLVQFRQAHLQKHFVRIIFAAPVFVVCSVLELVIGGESSIAALARSLYFAVFFSTFFLMLVDYCGEESIIQKMEELPEQKYPFPFCFCTYKPGREFFYTCKNKVLRCLPAKIVLTIFALVIKLIELEVGSSMTYYVSMVANCIEGFIMGTCLSNLITFEGCTREFYGRFDSQTKLGCLKFLLIFPMSQGIDIKLLIYLGIIEESGLQSESFSSNLSNFLLCIEFLPIAIYFTMVYALKSKEESDEGAIENSQTLELEEYHGSDVKEDLSQENHNSTTFFKSLWSCVNITDLLTGYLNSRHESINTPRPADEDGVQLLELQ
eukprot:TRINITY_DN3166_c0_g1_i3.p1 TRINITY_DN3166_c0_g1~~TRINITY_DN3166_c0_g1_i3.p1  ORF type:complete len:374 (+),score=51.54 TRINITY_DN3166_c0_g1_i3:39-1160(+)